MKPGPQPITAEQAREIFHYDPETGIFMRPGRGKWSVKPAGCFHVSSGYWVLKVNCKQVLAHRLAWLWVHGEWFEDFYIDHINHDKLDNRICNLRKATHVQNLANTRKVCNKTGFKGVYEYARNSGPRWFAMISVDQTSKYLGSFDSPEEASAVYRKASVERHGEFIPILEDQE